MFASRHTSKIDRPPSACLKIRILSSVLYFLPFIRLVPFRPDYLIPRLEKAQSRQSRRLLVLKTTPSLDQSNRSSLYDFYIPPPRSQSLCSFGRKASTGILRTDL